MEERQGRHVVRIEQKEQFPVGPDPDQRGAGTSSAASSAPSERIWISPVDRPTFRQRGSSGRSGARGLGDVQLDSALGELQVKTASGDISVGAVGADSSLVTVSGDLGVDRLDASLTARSVSGDVTIGAIVGELGLSTTSGDVDLKSVLSGDIRVQTVSGDVRLGSRVVRVSGSTPRPFRATSGPSWARGSAPRERTGQRRGRPAPCEDGERRRVDRACCGSAYV